jgi:DHA1 family quinolone resistance protein-like MFS transporter
MFSMSRFLFRKRSQINENSPQLPLLSFVILVNSLAMFGFSLFGLIQPLYLDDLNLGKSEFGLLFFFSNIISTVLRIPVGWASDLYGRRWFMLIGLASWGLAGVCFPVSKTFEALIVPFLLWGVGAAFYFTTNRVFIADITSSEIRAKIYGTVGFYNTVGGLLGPLIGGFITDTFMIETSFLLVGAAFSISFIACLKLPNPRQDVGTKQSITETFKRLTGAGVGRIVGVFAILYFIHGMYGGVLWPILPIFYKEFYGLTPSTIGLISTLTSIGLAIGNYVVARLPQTLDSKKVMAYSMIPSGVLLLFYLFAGSPILLFVVVFVFGFTLTFNMLGPLGNTLFMGALPTPTRGVASGVTGSTWRAGMSCGSIILGTVWASYGLTPIFYLCAAILFSEFIIIWVGLPRQKAK